jgi:hypothetical protein
MVNEFTAKLSKFVSERIRTEKNMVLTAHILTIIQLQATVETVSIPFSLQRDFPGIKTLYHCTYISISRNPYVLNVVRAWGGGREVGGVERTL